jgi:hypothetical protein
VQLVIALSRRSRGIVQPREFMLGKLVDEFGTRPRERRDNRPGAMAASGRPGVCRRHVVLQLHRLCCQTPARSRWQLYMCNLRSDATVALPR